MLRPLTDGECKVIIKRLGQRLKVDPKLIVTRLLSEDDKNDMRKGNLPAAVLELAITLWIAAGMPDYAHGKTDALHNDTQKCIVI